MQILKPNDAAACSANAELNAIAWILLCLRRDRLVADWHGLEGLQLALNLGPLRRILLGANGCIRVGVVILDVGLEAWRYRVVGILNQTVKQLGVRVIRQAITARTNRRAGIQVPIGKRLVRLNQPAYGGAKGIGG